MVLHELGHIALGHNRIDYRGTEAELALSERFTSDLWEAGGVERVVEFLGTQSSFELAADIFAVEVLDGSLREPMLEAASLWCAANERAHPVSGGDRFDDLKHMFGAPQKYPSPAVRVWYLNGRMSSGRRAGAMARQIAEAAESAGFELQLAGAPAEPARELAVFAALWDLVEAATAEDASLWKPPQRRQQVEASQVPEPEAPEQETLVRGLNAWEAGDLQQAEQLFRVAARATDLKLSAQAHRLIGRMLEEQATFALPKPNTASAMTSVMVMPPMILAPCSRTAVTGAMRSQRSTERTSETTRRARSTSD